MVAEAVGQFRPARRHVQCLLAAVAPDNNGHRHRRIEAYRLLHVLKPMNRPAIYLENDVPRMNPALLGGTARLDLSDFGRGERLAISHEQHCQRGNGKDEVRRRPGCDNRGALAQPLVMKRDLPLGFAQTRKARCRQA